MEKRGQKIIVSERKDLMLEKLLSAYAAYFDIKRNALIEGEPIAAFAKFHSRSEKYVLVKSAQLWAAEMNEYTYFILLDHLDPDTWRHYRDLVREEGLKQIKPHKEHMYSYVSMILLTDGIDPQAAREIRRCRFHRSYRLSLHGWMEFRIAAVDLTGGEIVSNPQGKILRKTIHQVLDQESERRKV